MCYRYIYDSLGTRLFCALDVCVRFIRHGLICALHIHVSMIRDVTCLFAAYTCVTRWGRDLYVRCMYQLKYESSGT